MDKIQFVSELAKLRPSATFLTLVGYRNEYSEVANYSILFHMSYKNALEKSIAKLEAFVPTNALQTVAKQELLNSFQTSLAKAESTPVEEIDDAYTRFYNSDGEYIKGVKMHTATGALHLYGLVVHKRVLMPGMYPSSNRRELTKVKDELRGMCPVGKFRQFKMLPSQVEHISVEKTVLLPPGA
jgi:hypothetical protein